MEHTSNAENLPVPAELVQMLMEIGYVAIGRGLQSHAESIFAGVIAARPSSELPLIGLAVCKINFGDFLAASKILTDRALKINPDSGMAKCFLAIAIKTLGGGKESKELASQVAETCTDQAAVALAKSILAGKDIAL
ncbi:MAG: hypothetical protein LBI81_02255 [Puniceicoccales bacterium]|jgi:thioredoxin-like negative regulator of GroEL|nr:hypothetical protein [Puniceicoccales bacterium]